MCSSFVSCRACRTRRSLMPVAAVKVCSHLDPAYYGQPIRWIFVLATWYLWYWQRLLSIGSSVTRHLMLACHIASVSKFTVQWNDVFFQDSFYKVSSCSFCISLAVWRSDLCSIRVRKVVGGCTEKVWVCLYVGHTFLGPRQFWPEADTLLFDCSVEHVSR